MTQTVPVQHDKDAKQFFIQKNFAREYLAYEYGLLLAR